MEDIVYRNDDGTGKVTTRYDHQYHAGSFQASQRTVTLPVVPTGQNGDGQTDTQTQQFESRWPSDLEARMSGG